MSVFSTYAHKTLLESGFHSAGSVVSGMTLLGTASGAALGGFSDDSTALSGAFKGALIGGGAGIGLKLAGNRYSQGFINATESFNKKHLNKSYDFDYKLKDKNSSMQLRADSYNLLASFNPAFFDSGASLSFNKVDASKSSQFLADRFTQSKTLHSEEEYINFSKKAKINKFDGSPAKTTGDAILRMKVL